MVLGVLLFNEFDFLGVIFGDVTLVVTHMDHGILKWDFAYFLGTGSVGVVISFRGAEAACGVVYF